MMLAKNRMQHDAVRLAAEPRAQHEAGVHEWVFEDGLHNIEGFDTGILSGVGPAS